jgi:hypothetical protein
MVKMKNKYVSEIEKKYPQATSEFKKIQSVQYETFCKKLNDYGPYNVTLGRELKSKNDIQIALSVILVRINDKVQRLINLLFHNKNEQIANEPLIDSFKDLGVYAIIAEIMHGEKWNK